MYRVHTYRCARIRRWVGRSKDTEPLPVRPFYRAYIIDTRYMIFGTDSDGIFLDHDERYEADTRTGRRQTSRNKCSERPYARCGYNIVHAELSAEMSFECQADMHVLERIPSRWIVNGRIKTEFVLGNAEHTGNKLYH